MKKLITILLGCIAYTCLSQNAALTFGRYPDCVRRGGICSATTTSGNDKSNTSNLNATFIQHQDGATTLRIYRQLITDDEEESLLGANISTQNINSLSFTQHDALPLNEQISVLTAENPQKRKNSLVAKVYLTTISKNYIDIRITEND